MQENLQSFTVRWISKTLKDFHLGCLNRSPPIIAIMQKLCTLAARITARFGWATSIVSETLQATIVSGVAAYIFNINALYS
jgi:hypothetical protein